MKLEALAPFEPLATLARRTPTLEGAVPVRVAQACVPLLEGNAFGFQVRFTKPLLARTRLGRPMLISTPELEHVDRMHRASARYLIEHGVIRGPWTKFFSGGWYASTGGRLRIWTGLCVRPGPRTWLRISGTKNRGVHGLDVDETFVTRDELVPLVLDFVLPRGDVRLVGEVATLATVRPGICVEVVPIQDAEHLAREHATFYDEAYFAKKRDAGEVTRKYRRTVSSPKHPVREDSSDPVTIQVAHIAGPEPTIVRDVRVLSHDSATPVSETPTQPFERVRFTNAVSFSARYDGYSLVVEPDRAELAAGARAVEGALGASFAQAHRGALLYLTKYFTPHPPGEPHFFVKPWAFVASPRGWSSLLEGVRGPGFDVMRGVVRTDSFHATPAVFQLHGASTIEVPCGAPLLDVLPIPRSLLDAELTLRLEA